MIKERLPGIFVSTNRFIDSKIKLNILKPKINRNINLNFLRSFFLSPQPDMSSLNNKVFWIIVSFFMILTILLNINVSPDSIFPFYIIKH